MTELHHDLNPGMYGQAPEPIERNLGELLKTTVENSCGVGLATDGDADRIGLVDEEGTFVDSHKILALLVKYLHAEKRLRGDIVKTFSTTDMLDKMGAQYGLNVVTTPIGFKYIGPLMVERDVLVGGEESGGMAVKGHIPERDGLYIGLLVVEMMVKRERTLSGLVRELMDEFGPHYQSRQDLHTTPARKDSALAELEADGLRRGRRAAGRQDGDARRLQVPDRRTAGSSSARRAPSPSSASTPRRPTQDRADALVQWGVDWVNDGLRRRVPTSEARVGIALAATRRVASARRPRPSGRARGRAAVAAVRRDLAEARRRGAAPRGRPSAAGA